MDMPPPAEEAPPAEDVTLAEWLENTGTKLETLAGRLGVSGATVSRIANRKQTPSLDLALAIHQATDGKVPVASLTKRAA